jgi:hypothetical protein
MRSGWHSSGASPATAISKRRSKGSDGRSPRGARRPAGASPRSPGRRGLSAPSAHPREFFARMKKFGPRLLLHLSPNTPAGGNQRRRGAPAPEAALPPWLPFSGCRAAGPSRSAGRPSPAPGSRHRPAGPHGSGKAPARVSGAQLRRAQASRRAAHSASGTSASSVAALRSSRTRSPVFRSASPPPTAASGEAFRIEGLSEVPDCRPSPTVGRWFTPARISASGGCMFTTSAEPG